MSHTFKKFLQIETVITDDVEYDYGTPILSEAIHEEIQTIMDADHIHPSQKLPQVVDKVRELIQAGQSTGLESDKPKMGSSRAVFFPRDHKKIILDGQEVHVPTAIKIAFAGTLDRHTGSKTLLGEYQNMKENDRYHQQEHGIIRKMDNGHYETNPNGILMPVFSGHGDGHHLECGRCEKYNSADLRKHTKNADFPKGISHQQILDSMLSEHDAAHGYGKGASDAVIQHPHVAAMIDMMHNSEIMPHDLSPRNMGVFVHPITGARHPVIIDYGFDRQISKLYLKARDAKYKESKAKRVNRW